MVERRGCYDINDVPRHEWMYNNPVHIADMLNDRRITLVEKSWFLSNSCEATAQELTALAEECQKAVLPLWYAKHQMEPIPRNAIFAEPRIAMVVQAIYAINPKDRIYAACVAAKGTDKENDLLTIFKNTMNEEKKPKEEAIEESQKLADLKPAPEGPGTEPCPKGKIRNPTTGDCEDDL